MFVLNERKIDSLLSKTYSDTLPGVTVAILHEGKTVFKKSYGVSNAVTKSRITSASDFNICSLTKQFTAIAILQLEEKHLLSLNDKISRFFPNMNKKLADAITIQQLLTHSSGIPDHYDHTNINNMKHAHDSDVCIMQLKALIQHILFPAHNSGIATPLIVCLHWSLKN